MLQVDKASLNPQTCIQIVPTHGMLTSRQSAWCVAPPTGHNF